MSTSKKTQKIRKANTITRRRHERRQKAIAALKKNAREAAA